MNKKKTTNGIKYSKGQQMLKAELPYPMYPCVFSIVICFGFNRHIGTNVSSSKTKYMVGNAYVNGMGKFVLKILKKTKSMNKKNAVCDI